MDETPSDVQVGYDRVAEEYASRLADELQHKPLDRELLGRFAEQVRPLGLACDMGCGPGHVARYIHDQGTLVMGVDLSPRMVEIARQLNPGIDFVQGDMLSPPIPGQSLGGIAVFYSIIHIPRERVVDALVALRRTLKPGGMILLAFHIGDEINHLEELWGHPISIDFIFFRPEVMKDSLEQAGFLVLEVIEREPYPDVEYPSRRAYIFAESPIEGLSAS